MEQEKGRGIEAVSEYNFYYFLKNVKIFNVLMGLTSKLVLLWNLLVFFFIWSNHHFLYACVQNMYVCVMLPTCEDSITSFCSVSHI